MKNGQSRNGPASCGNDGRFTDEKQSYRFGPYFIEPVIAGIPAASAIEPNPKPFICNMDT